MFLRTRRGRIPSSSSSSSSTSPSTANASNKSAFSLSAGALSEEDGSSDGHATGGVVVDSTRLAEVGFLFFNFFTSIGVTFINEAVFSKAEFGFPSILCLNGFMATFVGTEILRWFSLVEPIKTPAKSSPSSSPAPTTTTTILSSTTTTPTTPTAVAMGGSSIPSPPAVAVEGSTTTTATGVTIRDPNFLVLVLVVGLSKTLNNFSLKHNSMGVYQIFKLLVTPVVVGLDYCLEGNILSMRQAMCLAMVCIFCVGSIRGDLHISTTGLAWATVWVPFAAIFKVQWARVKLRYGCSTAALMHAVMPYACLLQLVIAPLVDPPGLSSYQWTLEAVLLLSMSAFAAFFVLFSSFLVLGHVGPLSHTLMGPLKTATTMMGSYFLFQTQYSAAQLLTATGALLSLVAYTHVTMAEQQHQQLQKEEHLLPTSNATSSGDKGDSAPSASHSPASHSPANNVDGTVVDESEKVPLIDSEIRHHHGS